MPPVVSVTATAGSITSGASAQLSVLVRDTRGATVSQPSVIWASSNSTVATVSATGVVTGVKVGSTTISASSLGTSGSVNITVTPGAPSALVTTQQPTVGVAGEPLPAVIVEVRDAAGNLVPTAAITVTAAVNAGATLTGRTSVNTVGGAATFSELSIGGATGARTLTFTAPALSATTAGPIAIAAGRPAVLGIRTQPDGAVAGQVLGTQPVIEVRDAFGNITESASPVSVTLNGGGTLAGTTNIVPTNGVATFTNLAVGGAIGSRTLAFSLQGVATVNSNGFALAAGAPAQLVLTRAPTGAGLNGAFTTQPIVEVRDAFSNRTTSTATITASVSAGGGTLTGASVAAVNGMATFTALAITGIPGQRTLQFGSGALAAATATVTPCDGTRGPRLSASNANRVLSAAQGGGAAEDVVTIVDDAGSCTPIPPLSTNITYTSGASWLTAAALVSPSRVVLTATPGALALGEYRATVTVSAAGVTSLALSVAFTVNPSITVTYGSIGQKIYEVDEGSTLRVAATARNANNVDVSNTLSYVSRSPSFATVANDGTISGVLNGPAWMVARESSGAADSIYVNVRRASGPVLRLDLSSFTFSLSGTFSVNLILDTRGTTVGAGQLAVAWPTSLSTPGVLSLLQVVPGTSGNPLITSDAEAGLTRISIASAGGLRGVFTIARFDFRASVRGTNRIVLSALDLLDTGGASLGSTTTSLQYPLVVR